jgi:CRISPR/Cas system-associated exonuclease Cas4 (RecB family)
LKPADTLTSWSYSVYCKYIECPHRIFLEKIKRVRMPEAPNPNMARGNMVHEGAQIFVSTPAKKPKLIKELALFRDGLERLRKFKARVEQDWAFDIKWEPVAWNDWKRAWLRVKVDSCLDAAEPKPIVEIIDYKTGKVYDDHRQQRSLYGLAGLRLVQLGELAGGDKNVKLTAQHWYLDTGQTATEEFTMNDFASLKRNWLTRIKGMMSDTKFKPQTGYHCRWCPYAKSKGGPCPEKM